MEGTSERPLDDEPKRLYATLTRTLFGPPREVLDVAGLKTVRRFVSEGARDTTFTKK